MIYLSIFFFEKNSLFPYRDKENKKSSMKFLKKFVLDSFYFLKHIFLRDIKFANNT